MAIRSKLTTRSADGDSGTPPGVSAKAQPAGEARTARSDEEKAKRKERVAAAKDALARSNGLKGDHVPPARAALKSFLQRLNEPRQPDDETFAALLEAPFRAPRKQEPGRGRGGFGGR